MFDPLFGETLDSAERVLERRMSVTASSEGTFFAVAWGTGGGGGGVGTCVSEGVTNWCSSSPINFAGDFAPE